MQIKIPFASQSYRSRSIPLSAQRVVNLYAELQTPSSKEIVALFGTPGLPLHATLGNGPIRGMIGMAGSLFVVSGSRLFKLESNGDSTTLGDLPGTAMVQMETNGTQIAILTGTEADNLFIATATTLTQVTDVDFPGATSVVYLDGYFVFTRTDTDQFFISAINDGTAFDALEFASAEGAPDNLVGASVDHRELWLFGEETTEIWYNSGETDFPFERASGAYIERGCIARDSIVNIDNSLMWVGDDKIVYRADGYSPRKVSTHAVEAALEKAGSLGDVVAFTYTQEGHAFYVLKKPDTFTFVYDVATDLWHERESHNRQDYRVSTFAEAFKLLLVGDDSNGNIYRLDLNSFTENGETIVASATAPPLFADSETAIANNLIIDFEHGEAMTTGQGSDPQAMLDWSDDGGKTWVNEKWRSIGRKGQYPARAKWDRMGQFRQRTYRVKVSDPVKRVISSIAYADIEGAGL